MEVHPSPFLTDGFHNANLRRDTVVTERQTGGYFEVDLGAAHRVSRVRIFLPVASVCTTRSDDLLTVGTRRRVDSCGGVSFCKRSAMNHSGPSCCRCSHPPDPCAYTREIR